MTKKDRFYVKTWTLPCNKTVLSIFKYLPAYTWSQYSKRYGRIIDIKSNVRRASKEQHLKRNLNLRIMTAVELFSKILMQIYTTIDGFVPVLKPDNIEVLDWWPAVTVLPRG